MGEGWKGMSHGWQGMAGMTGVAGDGKELQGIAVSVRYKEL